jgi:nitrogenase molybdenum-iron protein beta chain
MARFVDRPKYTCALGGALATIAALPRTVPIIHAASGCGLNLSYAHDSGSGYFGYGYCGGGALPSTNVTEREIVFGGEKRLVEQIEETISLIDGDLYIVVSGCMVEMIGDDISVAVEEAETGDARIIFTETGGFRGNSYVGYDLVMSSIFEQYSDKKCKKIPGSVNILGLVPTHDVFFRGNLKSIRELLAKIGVQANTFFLAEDDPLRQLHKAGEATLNIVLSDRFGVDSAKVLENLFDTPYITTGLPIGAYATAAFLRQVTKALSLDPVVTEELIQAENAAYFKELLHFSNLYNDYDLQRYVIIVADSNYAPALSRFVADDLGFLPEIAIINDQIELSEQENVISRFASETGLIPEIVFEVSESAVLPAIRNHWELDRNNLYYDAMTPAVILGSAFEIDLAADLNLPVLCVSYPITNRVVLSRGYAGYTGGLTLTEDLLTTLVSAR